MIQQEKVSAKLSLKERDRRYALIRAGLKEKGVDCVIVNGSNLFYLTNGVPGELYGILTVDEVPPCVIVNRRHLVDISTQVLIEAQEWVSDFRPGTDGSAAVERIRELHLDKGTLAVAGGLSYRFYAQLQSALSSAKIVDVSDIFTNVRTVKSEEEVALIDKANRVRSEERRVGKECRL